MQKILGLMAISIFLTGCGASSKPAGTPTNEMIEADKAAQKKVEDEERGTPVKKSGKR